VLVYFRNVEEIFQINNISDDLWVNLLTPFLNSTARKAVQNLKLEERMNYEKWKRVIILCYNLSASLFRKNFREIFRCKDENSSQFLNRLRIMLDFYLESRKVNDFEALKDLLLADRLKETLRTGVREYIKDHEINGLLSAQKISDLVDRYEEDKEPDKPYFAGR